MTGDWKKQLKQVSLAAGISLLGSTVLVGINLLVRVIFEPNTINILRDNPVQFKELAAVQFDILIIAASLLIGAGISISENARGLLFWPLILLGIGLIALLVLAIVASIFKNWHPDLMRLVVPDLLSIFLLFCAIRATVMAKLSQKPAGG